MKDLRRFITHCLNDDEFWMRGGIPTQEKQFVEALGMTEEQMHEFYDAMCGLQHLAKEIEGSTI